MKKKNLSIVIPCYRESKRLPTYLNSLVEMFQGNPNVNFIIIDDGSPHKEFSKLKQKIQNILSNPQFTLFHYEKNIGKGHAIQYGLEKTEGNYLGFIDADGATPAYEVKRMWDHINIHNEIDLIVGSRIPMHGKTVKKSFHRHIANRIFSFYFHKIFEIQIYDPQCGCKIFKRSSYDKIKGKITDLRWLWDTQLLILFHRNHQTIVEFPIDWNEIPNSKFSFFKDSFSVLLSIWKYRKLK
ncbi:glycosyltransferase [Leptospira sp. WS39.C2]